MKDYRDQAGISGKGGKSVQAVYKELGITPSVTLSDIKKSLQPSKTMPLAKYAERLRKNPNK